MIYVCSVAPVIPCRHCKRCYPHHYKYYSYFISILHIFLQLILEILPLSLSLSLSLSSHFFSPFNFVVWRCCSLTLKVYLLNLFCEELPPKEKPTLSLTHNIFKLFVSSGITIWFFFFLLTNWTSVWLFVLPRTLLSDFRTNYNGQTSSETSQDQEIHVRRYIFSCSKLRGLPLQFWFLREHINCLISIIFEELEKPLTLNIQYIY